MIFRSMLTVAAALLLNDVSAQIFPYFPSSQEMEQRYANAAVRDSISRQTIFKTSVNPQWMGASAFWYANRLPEGRTEYIYVEAEKNKRISLFDGDKLVAALESASGKSIPKDRFQLRNMYVAPGAVYAVVELEGNFWKIKPADYTVEKTDIMPKDTTSYPGLLRTRGRWEWFRGARVSPDGKYTALVRDHNIFIEPKDGGAAIQYTTDGTSEKPYGDLAWSPDGSYLVGYRVHRVEDKPVYYILTAQEGTTRGELKSHNYKQPGDEFSTYEMYIVNRENKTTQKVNTDVIDFFSAPRLQWFKNSPGKFLYERVDRGHQRFRIIEVDAATASTRNIVDEKTNTFIYEQRIFTHYMPDTGEILWVSEKDGWRHIYLVDGKAGTIKNAVTKGEWVVRSVDSIDVKKREVWFQASGMNPSEDPYHIHYYRIGFDGKKLVSLTPQPGNHRLSFSPDKKYFVDTYSSVNVPPVSIVGRVADGKPVLQLEQADISRHLAKGFRLPEVFVSKGRDGKTDIWGVVYFPSDFDSTKKYPIIENIYAGPQDAFVPKSFTPTGEMQSLSELGFIVVQIDGMGTANRSKAFHDVCWQNLADAGFPDRISWMRALAARYPQADTGRVGLYGTSAGGQNALGGLLFHPTWYKAAVSACGCHDNRVDKQWWNEQWMGYPIGKHYEEQSNITNAHKLKGKLLLIVGEADTNVPPESTYRVADALIKAGKTFDFLAVPGMGHSDGGAYGRVKKRDFFVKNLLGAEPPDRNGGAAIAVPPGTR